MKQHISPCNCETCLKAKQDALDEQAERAEDHYASCLADIVEKIEKIKKAVQERNGTYKYDSCYDDIIKIIKK